MMEIVGFGVTWGAYAGPVAPQTFEPSTPGEILESIAGNGPRVVRPKASTYLPHFEIKNDYLSLDIPPGMFVMARNEPGYNGKTVKVTAADVLISNFRMGAGPGDRYYSNQVDSLALNGAKRVGLMNCFVPFGPDENIDIWDQSEDITIQYSIIGPGLRDTWGPGQGPGLGMLVGKGSKRVTIYRNLFYRNHGRNPRAKNATEVQVVGNTIFDHRDHAMDWSNASGDIEENIAIMGPNTMKTRDYLLSGDSSVSVFVDGNIQSGPSPLRHQASKINLPLARFCFPDARVQRVGAARAFHEVMNKAGPLQRTEIERRIIQNVLDEVSPLVKRPEDIGGWPVVAPPPPAPVRPGLARVVVPVSIELEQGRIVDRDFLVTPDGDRVIYTIEVD